MQKEQADMLLYVKFTALIWLSSGHVEVQPSPTVLLEVGDVCNELERCIEGTFCDSDGLCSCYDPQTQVFDPISKKCLAKVNESCTSSPECTPHANCILRWNSTTGHFSGSCRCVGRYFELPFDGTCGKFAAYGEKCSDQKNDVSYQPCDTAKNLYCDNKVCHCSHPNYVYDVNLKACAIRAGDSCYSHRSNPQVCVHGAKCRYHQPGSTSKAKLRCRCEAGYIRNDQGFCQPSYGQTCNEHRPCFANENATAKEMELICTGGKCQCSSPLYQQFDENLQKCVHRVGAPCFPSQSMCVPNAQCSLVDEGEGAGECMCSDGYSATVDGNCKLTFRMNCTLSAGNGTGSGECNSDAGLACDDGKCNCFDNFLAFDKAKGVCVNRLGGFCGVFKDPKTGRKFSVGCAGSSETKCIKHYMGGGGQGSTCFCSQDVKTLYPPKQYCDMDV